MVKLHAYIEDSKNWRSGMVLSKSEVFNAHTRVQVDREDRKLIIHCYGEEPRRLLTFIRKTLEEIARDFTRLDYDEKVAIPNDKELQVFKDYKELIAYERMDEKEIIIPELLQKIPVKNIL
jgi:hypothetical protein